MPEEIPISESHKLAVQKLLREKEHRDAAAANRQSLEDREARLPTETQVRQAIAATVKARAARRTS